MFLKFVWNCLLFFIQNSDISVYYVLSIWINGVSLGWQNNINARNLQIIQNKSWNILTYETHKLHTHTARTLWHITDNRRYRQILITTFQTKIYTWHLYIMLMLLHLDKNLEIDITVFYRYPCLKYNLFATFQLLNISVLWIL